MSTTDQPTVTIASQAHTDTPTTQDATIMDDTVVTMDSATALMGGLTVSVPVSAQTIETFKPQAMIRTRR